MRRSGRGRPRHRAADALTAFLLYLDEIDQAVLDRDGMRITALLRKRIATHLPREVREELLAFSRGARESLRAPVQFLRFEHRMAQLARGGERLLTAQRELALDDPAESDVRDSTDGSGAARRRDEERRAAASDSAADRGRTPATDSPSRRPKR